MLLLDDLQWADELTLGFLEDRRRLQALEAQDAGMPVASESPAASGPRRAAPLLVVGAYRSEEVDTGPGPAGARQTSPLQRLIDDAGPGSVVLGRMEEPAVGCMVGDMLALSPPPALFVRHLARHSEGNPFFVAEYLRAAVGEGLRYRDGRGRWQVAEQAEERATQATYEALALPRTLRELVARRIGGLSPAARKLAEASAVLGREAELNVLRRMARLDEGRLLDALNELLRRQVLEAPAPGRLRFVHDKIREVSYAGLRKDRRKNLHRAAAASVEALHAEDLSAYNAALGRHWEESGDPERARSCYLAAARQSLRVYDHAEAERLYRAYLQLVEEPTSDTVAARNELGEKVLLMCGRSEEALLQQSKPVDEARRLGDRSLEGETLRMLGRVYQNTGRPEQARQLLEQSHAIHREVGDRRGEGNMRCNLGVLHMEQGCPEQTQQLYEQAIAVFRQIGDKRSEGIVLGNLAAVHVEQGRPEEARQLHGQSLAIRREVGDRRSEGITLLNLANLERLATGNLANAAPLAEQAEALLTAGRPGPGRFWWVCFASRGTSGWREAGAGGITWSGRRLWRPPLYAVPTARWVELFRSCPVPWRCSRRASSTGFSGAS